MILEFETRFLWDIVAECKVWDEKNKTAETMQMTIFSILDPQGRTIMLTLFHTWCTAFPVKGVRTVMYKWSHIHTTMAWGHTMTTWSLISIHMWVWQWLLYVINEFRALVYWVFGTRSIVLQSFPQIPIYLAVLFSSEQFYYDCTTTRPCERGFCRDEILCKVYTFATGDLFTEERNLWNIFRR